ncbi:uncharacterized protein A1O9_01411 [Exophiala aquamarina CBS 119918]|uniref:Heterokaryon incompatibility domain-containing protein n=1 Tax=Exophiala aquamarina CBS 119918 TaxID=1182545 RepID=A0A072PVR1_9EURO|nr:uncharacterized protein A1O9_01411 [Exophiala aquamarina CBS 119918]KEF63433.1 hypothetical protein A1O9_01411 [Exophiala aquamarina CBS 119918]
MDNLSSLQLSGSLGSPDVILPNVIEDAMTLVGAIRERYLWVDSLCIVQDDAAQKHQSIMQMDLIYREAVLTIVAASGEDANSPLPGVRLHSRPPQVAAAVSGVTWVTTPPMLQDLLRRSHYESRGWTFQERLLSRRCLYFSSQWVYFECPSTIKAEAWLSDGFPVGRAYEFPEATSHNPLVHLLNEESSPASMRTFETYYSLVGMYQERSLSYATDILNAFSGVMTYFQELTGTTFACGLPESGFDRALLWVPTGVIQRRRGETSSPNSSGELCCPSWSWAGWIGKVQWLDVATEDQHFPVGNRPTLRSEVRYFYFGAHGKSRAVRRRDIISPPSENASSSSSTHTPNIDPKLYILRFIASTIRAKDFTAIAFIRSKPFVPKFGTSLIYDSNKRQCGIMYEKQPPHFEDNESSIYELVKLSTSPPRGLSDDHWGYITRVNPRLEEVFDSSYFRPDRGVVNAMLVKSTGEFSERVALCQMHSDVFTSATCTMKRISLI